MGTREGLVTKHQEFLAEGHNFKHNTTKSIRATTHRDEVVMGIPGLDSDYTYITKEQAMKFFGLIDPEQETPWVDCKVAFDILKDSDDVWQQLFKPDVKLPKGWAVSETDDCGARSVIIFRIEGVPLRVEDGEVVKKILLDIENNLP